MISNWRIELKREVEDYYVQGPQEWFDMTISAAGTLNLIIVSDRFINMPLQQRREQIRNLITTFDVPLSVGFLSLYTPQEAATLELARPSPIEDSPAYSWFDLAQQAANASESPTALKREPRIPRTITFYSFKGGVGRTTALIHVAVLLAMRGRKVVAVDLDSLLQGAKQAELQIGEKQPVPTDRLLSIEALQVGLAKASQVRYDEMRKEYPKLQPFFDALVSKSFTPSAEHLQGVWRETIQTRLPEFGEFSKFISFLESTGFIALIARSSLNGPIYGLGPVYQHVLGWSTL
jgi:AAA domain